MDNHNRRESDKPTYLTSKITLWVSVLTMITLTLTLIGYMSTFVATKTEIKQLSIETEILRIDSSIRLNRINMRLIEAKQDGDLKLTLEEQRRYNEYKSDNLMLKQQRANLISSLTLIKT